MITSIEGAARTTIDCNGAGRAFRLSGRGAQAVRIERLTIRDGRQDRGLGGGIYCDGGPVTIEDCTLIGNSAGMGGGIYVEGAQVNILRCVIMGNHASCGAGIYATQSECTIEDCLITGNRAENTGGGLTLLRGTSALSGCTISANSAGQYGGGMLVDPAFQMQRCIVWGNCASLGDAQVRNPTALGSSSMACCDVDSTGVGPRRDLVTFTECIFSDPGMCAPAPCGQSAEGDWALKSSSVCLPARSPCGKRIGARDQNCDAPPSTRACCLSDHRCVVATEAACRDSLGTYLGEGEGVGCLPDPCVNPVETTSSGRLKRRFGRNVGG